MTVALRSLHSSRMVILLVAVVLLTTAMFISFSTQFVKFKITVVGTNAGHRDATGASLRATQMNDTRYYGLNEHPGCAFLRSNSPRHSGGSEHHWGAQKTVCMSDVAVKWLQISKTNCYSCLHPERNICHNPPAFRYHMSLDHLHPELPEANLLAIQAFLMTQDLTQARFTLWIADPATILANNASAWLFNTFSQYLQVQQFNYTELIQDTVWEHDPFFGNASLVKQHMSSEACFSDLVRILVLHKFGGFWMDTDVIFYQDLTHLLQTSYQFTMRWQNIHVLRLEANSSLTRRMMQVATTMPQNHPDFEKEIIDKLCKKNGYYQLVAGSYKFMDIYNACLFRLLLKFNNTGPPDAVLYDLPLGWFDTDWAGCFESRKAMNDTKWWEVASKYLAMHNRYPGDKNLGPDSSPLQRVIRIIRGFFKACRGLHCLPVQGMQLVAYDGLYEQPEEARNRLLLQLKQQGERPSHTGAGSYHDSSNKILQLTSLAHRRSHS